MARARNLKPGFFKNEDLAECTPWARLCFAGLWTLADREGRLEDRPKRIKGELFAFDSIEVEPLLAELVSGRFIHRYQAPDGRGLIQVLQFHKHQNPHHREPESDFPPPQSPGLLVDATTPKPQAEAACNDTKAPGQPQAGPRLDPPRSDLARGSSRAESGIDESGALIPESGNSERASAAAPPPFARPREEPPPEVNGQPATAAGSACIAIRQAGIGAVNPGHPDLLRLLAAGVTPQDFADTAAELVGKGKGKFPLLLATVEGRLRDAADAGAVPMAPPDPMAWRKTADGVFAMAERLGVKPAPDELFHVFERRVLTAFQRAGQAQETAA